jgi:hypothetical protein
MFQSATGITTSAPLPLKDIYYEDDTSSVIYEYYVEPSTESNVCTHLESLKWNSWGLTSTVAICLAIKTERDCLA